MDAAANRRGRGGVPEANRAHEWLKRYGLNVRAGEKFVPQSIFMAPRESVRIFLRALFSGDGGVYQSKGACFLEYYSKSRRLIEDVHHLLLRFGIFSSSGKKTRWNAGLLDSDHQQEQIARFAQEIGFVAGSVNRRSSTSRSCRRSVPAPEVHLDAAREV
jgi:hypothetical protein